MTTISTGQTVTVQIAVESSASPTTVAAGGVAFDPQGPDTTTVDATIPGFIATTAASRDVTVTGGSGEGTSGGAATGGGAGWLGWFLRALGIGR